MPPSAADDIPWDRLGLWLTGQLSAEEAEALQAWMAADPAREELLASVRGLWAVTEPGGPSRSPEQVLHMIKQRAAEPVRVLPMRPRFEALPTQARRRPVRHVLVAAAIAAVVAGAWWTSRAGWWPSALTPSPAATAVKEYRTDRGQRLALNLPDGSSVMLGPESVLRYSAAAYGRTAREVELQGEGYFDVTHDEARPFAVHTGHAIARDLGTKFTVRARESEAAVEVAVAEGRVALSPAGRPAPDTVLLDPGDLGRVRPGEPTAVRRDVALDAYFGWTEGRLVFEATPLATVVDELRRWYAADIRLEGAGLGERTLTATFHNEPVTKVLPMIRASLGLTLRRVGSQYILSGK